MTGPNDWPDMRKRRPGNSAAGSGGEVNGTDSYRRAETVADITSRFDPSLDWDDLVSRSANGGPARCYSKGRSARVTRCGPLTPASTGCTCRTTEGASSTGR